METNRHQNSVRYQARVLPRLVIVLALLAWVGGAFGRSGDGMSLRETFNSASASLQEGKLREAEALLENVLDAQKEGWRVPALYNLGHARFTLGMDELKKSESAGPAAARGRATALRSEEAITDGRDALKNEEVERLVSAYVRGRGVRREMRSAIRAVRKALEIHAVALNRLERASGDWKSAVELDPGNADARHNAEVAERHIAKVVDSIRDLQQSLQSMQGSSEQLRQMLNQMRGKIPEENMPPGAAGEEEEDEEGGMMPPPGTQEGPGTEGEERPISPDEAGWILEGFRAGEDKRLPMTHGREGEPKDRNRPTW
jgi:tetratricopeptide (TPR) repeat protein